MKSSYEKQQTAEIAEWKAKEPSVASKAIGYIFKPMGWVVEKVVPQKAVEGALTGLDAMAGLLVDKNDILRDGHVARIRDLRGKDLALSDEMAEAVQNWAVASAALEGGASGALGLPGIAVDVPALITMALRVIRKTGLCYGYEVDCDSERQFVYGVLSAASANTIKEKAVALMSLQKIAVLIAKTSWKDLAQSKVPLAVFVMTIKQLAKQVGINITKRKVAQALPLIGMGVGAAMNAAYIRDVAVAARRMYQCRWFGERPQLRAA